MQLLFLIFWLVQFVLMFVIGFALWQTFEESRRAPIYLLTWTVLLACNSWWATNWLEEMLTVNPDAPVPFWLWPLGNFYTFPFIVVTILFCKFPRPILNHDMADPSDNIDRTGQ